MIEGKLHIHWDDRATYVFDTFKNNSSSIHTAIIDNISDEEFLHITKVEFIPSEENDQGSDRDPIVWYEKN